jgi:hypothetical protein
VTEQVHRGEVARGQAEVREWVDLEEGEWVVPEPVQDQEEIACVQNAERLSPMKQERRATL